MHVATSKHDPSFDVYTSSPTHTCLVLAVLVDMVTVLVPTSAPASQDTGGQTAHRGAPARTESAMTVYNHARMWIVTCILANCELVDICNNSLFLCSFSSSLHHSLPPPPSFPPPPITPFLLHPPFLLPPSLPSSLRPGGYRDMFRMQLHGLCWTKLRPLHFQRSGSDHIGDSHCCHRHHCTYCVVHQEVKRTLAISIAWMKLTSRY